MAKTFSTMLPLGTPAPHFALKDVVSQKLITFGSQRPAKASVIMFICNHCPYVQHVNPELTRLANDYIPKQVQFIAINSNDIQHYPADAPELMREMAIQHQYPFPYLFDATQEVAKAYQAACTPDFFVFDSQQLLVYRGQLDDSRLGNDKPCNGESIRRALDAILTAQPVDELQKPSLGCNIKWRT